MYDYVSLKIILHIIKPKDMKKIISFLKIVFFVESHLKIIKWSKLGQIVPKSLKTFKIKVKIKITKKKFVTNLIFENN